MSKSLFISATDTGVGKTYYSAQIANELLKTKPGSKVAYFKPTQCGKAPNPETGELETDMDYIKNSCPGVDVYCGVFLECPAAPAVAKAVEEEGGLVDIGKIMSDFENLKVNYDFVIVEGAGGLAVPINMNFLISDLAKLMDIPLLIVTRPDLGTINHTVMSIEHARNKEIELAGVLVSTASREVKDLAKIQGKTYLAEDNPEFCVIDFADPSLPVHIKTAAPVIASMSQADIYTNVTAFLDDFVNTKQNA